jgi:exodeoxyribonuclease V gamma subunit
MDGSPQHLRIYRSNRMEKLAEALGDVLSDAPPDALAPECVLVPGRGLAQWLNMRLSERFGVWSNVLYLYPRNFVAFALDRVLGKSGKAPTAIDPERLLWTVFAVAKPLLEQPPFETLRHYVEADASGVRYFELCRRIAYTFDRYATYRPDMLQSWERRRSVDATSELPQLALFSGSRDPQAWQPILWRALHERLGPVYAGALERRFLRSLQQSKRLSNLPARITCFGVTHLPPSYARILVALCPHIPVHMFQLRATEHAPASGRAPSRGRSTFARAGGAATRGNPLVESLGALATDFDAVLEQELGAQNVDTRVFDLYVAPTGTSRLARLQRHLLKNQGPVAAERAPAGAASGRDESLQIHVCHSPMREVEVLHDQLMALLATEAGLEPRDVVVMLPDVESYAPLIEAVFRRSPGDASAIPFSIADRSVQVAAPVVDALGRVFTLAEHRFSTPEVLDLLSLEVVAARFGITPRDVEQVTGWLTRANVRWGRDAEHRVAHGHPRSDKTSWHFGLQRLLLGYAMDNDPPVLVGDVLPAPEAEGLEAAALGKLCDFVEALFAATAALATPHAPEAWPDVVGTALEALCVSDPDTAWQHEQVRVALRTLAENARGAGYSEPIGGAAYRELLFGTLDSARPARGLLMGGVTFCSMVPLCTLPFRVVCLVGLGDGELPRREQSSDFDLIAHGPDGRRVGDRSRRSEDRYLFLEAITSARERLIITYTGQSIRDNAALPPSVLVSELCDYLALTSPAGALAPLADVIVQHPLQAFSPRYFDASDPRLFSFAEHYVAGAAATRVGAPPEFFAGALSEPSASDAIGLTDLVRFFQNPTAYLLNRRLELFLRERDLEVPDREPQELSPLDKYAAGHALLELTLQGVPLEQSKRLILATGALPLGSPGELDFLEIQSAARAIAEQVESARLGPPSPASTIERRLPGGRLLIGTLPEAFAQGLVEYQFARLRAKHLLAFWIRHLVTCWLRPEGAQNSCLIGRPPQGSGVMRHELRAVAEPERVLDALVARYDRGQSSPLALFPATSLVFAQQHDKPQKAGADLPTLILREWRRELSDDPHLTRVFLHDRQIAHPLERASGPSGFATIALEVFEPLLAHLTTIEADT